MSGVRSIQDVLQVCGNDRCADCGHPEPAWVASSLGAFICDACAGIHNGLGPSVSKVKSVKLTTWDADQLKLLSETGNDVCKAKYEQNVPRCYRRPGPKDPQILREQWIRAKYERLEFVGEPGTAGSAAKQPYLSGLKEGQLWKRGKDDKHFQKRRFVLSAADNTLKYFNKELGDTPKASLRLDDLNVTVVPAKVGNPNAMQIMYDQDGQTRSLFLYSDSSQDAVEWYTAIRSAKLNRLAIAYPGASSDELCRMITRDFAKEGWLCKTGPRQGDAYRRRWVTVDKRKLLYYEDPMDAFPKGEVFIGSKGFEVVIGTTPGVKDPGNAFLLKTPDRSFQFAAETEDEMKDWIRVLAQVIDDPTR